MIYIKINNVKQFMRYIFAGDIFDNLYVTDCEIHTVTVINISGVQSKKWIETNESASKYCTWSQIKGIVYNVIRGNKSPSFLKIIFSNNSDEQVSTGTITLKFEDEKAVLITGFADVDFSLDKTMEKNWDKYVTEILHKYGVEIKKL